MVKHPYFAGDSLLGPGSLGYTEGGGPSHFGGGGGEDYNSIRRRRDHTSSWEDEFITPNKSKGSKNSLKKSKIKAGVGSIS